MIGLMRGLWHQASMQAYGYVMTFPCNDEDRNCGCIACANFLRLRRACPIKMQHPQHSGGINER